MDDADIYTRLLMGEHAVRVPLNLIVQGHLGNGRIAFVGTSRRDDPHPLEFGSRETHQLVVCDAIIRPQLVAESSAWKGTGLGALFTSSAMTGVDEWLRTGRVLLGPGRGRS